MEKELKKVTRTTEGLREVLFDELDGFLRGQVDIEHADTVQKLTGAILKTVAKDIEATKLLLIMNAGKDQPKAIADLNLNLMLTSNAEKSLRGK